MIKCEINEKEDKVLIDVEDNIIDCTKDLSILIKSLLESGMKLECPDEVKVMNVVAAIICFYAIYSRMR